MEIIIAWFVIATVFVAILLWRFISQQFSPQGRLSSASRVGGWIRWLFKWFILFILANAVVLMLLEKCGVPARKVDVQNSVLVVVACGFAVGFGLAKVRAGVIARRNHEAWSIANEKAEREKESRAVAEFNVRKQSEVVRKRKEDARARVEIYFNLNAPELGKRFTREMFDDYVGRYLTDSRTPEDVEAREEQLVQVIRQHLAKTKPWADLQTLDEILSTYSARRKKVQESDLDPRDRENLLVQLEEQQEKDVQKALREGRI